MAKKNKSNALFANQDVIIQTTDCDESPTIDMLQSMTSQKSRLTNENKEKLEMFDNIQTANSDLCNKNSELTEKLAEYIAELTTLREENKNVKALSSQIQELKDEIVKKNEEIDQYLIRISELTFENSRLRSTLPQNNQNSRSQISQTNKSNPIGYNPIPYKKTFNGYENWN